MTRFGIFSTALALALLALTGPAHAQIPATDQALQDCMRLPDPDRNIVDCSTVIDRGDRETTRNRAIAYLNRAIAYLQKNDGARGLADLAAALALDPSMTGAYYNRALYFHQAGELDRAKADYAEVIRLDPKMVNAYGNRATIHYVQGAFDLALADYEAALKLAPGNAGLIHQIGVVYFAMGEIARAIAQFDQALAIAPRAARFLFSRGRAFARQGDLARAHADFAAAHHADRKHDESKACLAATEAALDAQRRKATAPKPPEFCVRDPAVRA
jgi:Tfp pilus assembly protein PilF